MEHKTLPLTHGVIDIHTHAEGIEFFNLLTGRLPTTQSARDLSQKLTVNRVDYAAAFPIAYPLYHDPKVIREGRFEPSELEPFPYYLTNRALIQAKRLFQLDNLLPFACIHPGFEIEKQIGYLESVAGELFGLKLHTRATNCSALTLCDSPFIDFARRWRLPVLIHTKHQPRHTHCQDVLRVAEKVPDVNFCIAHLCDFEESYLRQVPRYQNVFVDTSPFLAMCHFAAVKDAGQIPSKVIECDFSTPKYVLAQLSELIPNQLIWGTDEPWTSMTSGETVVCYDYSQERQVLSESASLMDPLVNEAISWRNAGRFLGIDFKYAPD